MEHGTHIRREIRECFLCVSQLRCHLAARPRPPLVALMLDMLLRDSFAQSLLLFI